MFNSLPFLLCKYRSIATYRYACSLGFFLTVSPKHFDNVTTDFIFYYFVLCLLCLKRPQMPWEIRFSNGENTDGERERECGREVVETKHNRVTKLLKTDINLIKCDGCSTWTKPPPSFNQSFVSLPATKWDIKHEISEIEDMRYIVVYVCICIWIRYTTKYEIRMALLCPRCTSSTIWFSSFCFVSSRFVSFRFVSFAFQSSPSSSSSSSSLFILSVREVFTSVSPRLTVCPSLLSPFGYCLHLQGFGYGFGFCCCFGFGFGLKLPRQMSVS